MKKSIVWLCAVLLIISLAGCDSQGGAENDKKKSVVVTIFPVYDWVKNLLGENPAGVELTLLQDSGTDLHSYQPTAEDILKIASCDLFLYVGGESDDWVEDALAQAVNKDMVVLNLLEALGELAREEEEVEGMEPEDHDHDQEEAEDPDHEEEEAGEHGHEEGPEYDEHVWLSLKNARFLCGAIGEGLEKIDPANQAVYQANLADYQNRLETLDKEYEKAVAAASNRTLLFGDRFPFLYLTKDYGLDYYAAFKGCSAETEASFETIAFLSSKAQELALPCIMTLEQSDHRLAKTIAENTKEGSLKVLAMDSMQGTTAGDIKAGAAYLSIMEKNLEVLKEALK